MHFTQIEIYTKQYQLHSMFSNCRIELSQVATFSCHLLVVLGGQLQRKRDTNCFIPLATSSIQVFFIIPTNLYTKYVLQLLQCIEIKTLKTITKDEKTEDHYTFDKSIPRIDSLIFYNFYKFFHKFKYKLFVYLIRQQRKKIKYSLT